MNENLNLVEILKDCPEGTEFYSSIYGNVKFKRINKEDIKHPIEFYTLNDYHDAAADGRHLYMFDGECTFFPSKDQRDWSKWHRPFVDGDIVFYNDTIAIFKEWGDETLFRTYVIKYLCCDSLIDINTPLFGKGIRKEIRFATEKEKETLFQAIKSLGYKWNTETKTLEPLIVPKFKVGDTIVTKNGLQTYKITGVTSEYYSSKIQGNDCVEVLPVKDQDDWELVPNKTTKDIEEKKINQMSLANCDLDEVEIVLGDRFELKIKDGKYYAVRKKPIYPKTYEECCKVLGIDGYPITLINVTDEEEKLFINFIRLKRCRDAYWKIAGEQMGLGKPWKPVWDESEDLYTIHTFNGEIRLSGTAHRNAILVFPTEEMRDAFFENFKDLIESCKELL